MEGVIVQTERVYRGFPIAAAVIVFILFVAILVFLVVNAVQFGKKKAKARRAWALATLVSFVAFAVFTGSLMNEVLTIHKDLIVTIDDSVSFNEFNDRYKVVSQDGKLFTVRELPIEESDAEEAGDNE